MQPVRSCEIKDMPRKDWIIICAKPDTIIHFPNSVILNIYYLHALVYISASYAKHFWSYAPTKWQHQKDRFVQKKSDK